MNQPKIDENKRYKLNRPITGIIQKDRIWEQWYKQDIFKKELPKMSQKDYLLSCIGKEKDRIIINNRGKKEFTEFQFEQMILDYEKAFATMNLNPGDVICTISLTTPEMYAIKYAATSLGLITCNLNVLDVALNDNGKNRLYTQMKNVNPKMIFTLDILEKNIYQIINNETFSNAVKVSMPLTQSTPIYNPERAIISLKVLKEHLSGQKINDIITLNDFLNLGKKFDIENLNEIYSEKQGCNISFTSGTTGINKAVLLSHDANNALAFQQEVGEFGFDRNTKNLALVPPFLAFWDADIVHAVLCLGGVEIIELLLDYKKIPEYFKKHDVEMGIWSQYLWSSLQTLPEKDLKRISAQLKHPIIGGERCEKGAEQEFYDKVGVHQITGFGATEVNTTFSITHPSCNKIGAAGIPLPYNNVKIVDDSFNDVTYNQPGKLFITGPCMMNGYYNRDDLTKKVIYTDSEGTKWYNTGDYAVVDDDGCLTVIDRYIEPIEITSNGVKEKINMLDIVETIKTNENIKHAKMTNVNNNLLLHISLRETIKISKEEAIDSIINTIKELLPEKYWPNFINVYEDLPRTQVGKVNYNMLKQKSEEIVLENSSTEKLIVIKKSSKVLTKEK